MNEEPLIHIQDVSAGYNRETVLENIQLKIFPGDFLGVIGPNGSGKTTLLKLILGLIPCRTGTIRYTFSDSSGVYSNIGYLPQIAVFDSKFPITVLETVLGGMTRQRGLFRYFSKNDRQNARALLEKMGIPHLRHRHIGELSGGELQRTFLARALIASPRVLLLDEPDTFVDTAFSNSFYDLLREINKDTAVILVSHDLGMISSYVKSIACVNRTLFYHDSSEITQELLEGYHCPIDLITHGHLPHRVLKQHQHPRETPPDKG